MKKVLSRIISAGLSAALAVPVFAAYAENYDANDDEIVTFIVQTAAGTPTALLKAELEAGGTMSAMSISAAAEVSDERLEADNRRILETVGEKIGADISGSYVYTQLDSAFSITAKRSDKDMILAEKGVINICEAGTTEIIPDDESSEGEAVLTEAADALYQGQGTLIAVLDSGFCISHDYFSEAPSQVKYSEAEASALISDIGRGKYYSAKIPFVYDYYQQSDEDLAISNYADHGTHVAGIAAGKNGTIGSGDKISGTAPEAQLALMACGTSQTGINDAAYLAALNDAAKLGADVINMSFGSDYIDIRNSTYNARRTAVANARKSGIVICASSGNSSRGFYEDAPLVTDLDYGAGGLWQKDTDVISVASADATEYYTELTSIALADGSALAGLDVEAGGKYFKDTVTSATEYVDCGLGTAAEIAAVSLSGKVAVIRRGTLTFAEKTSNAKKAGAAAAVIYDNVEEEYPNVAGFELPTLFMTKSDGEMLLAKENKSLYATGRGLYKLQNTSTGGKPSSFSSWGVSEKLELVPNIMGYGGNIYSAAPDGGYQILSGTSMSSPYLAGICACVKSYLNTEPFSEVSSNTADMIQQLIMSTSDPVRYSGTTTAYSPRQQGAGLVNMSAALTAPVVLYNSDNKTLVNLGDNVGAEFTLSFTAHNYSAEDIKFDAVTVEVLTDDYISNDGNNYVNDMKPLTVKSYTQDGVTVNALGDTEITINVALDENELKNNAKVFTNGFYIDGFVRLANDDISVGLPFMGFYGSWGAMPIWDTTVYDEGGSSLISSDNGVNGTYLATTAANSTVKLGIDPNTKKYNAKYMIISPANGDKNMDALTAVFSMRRASHNLKLELLQDNVSKASRSISGYFTKFKSISYSYTNLAALADGEYTARLTGWFNDGKTKTAQTLYFPYKVIVDNTAPEVTQVLSEDKTALSVTAEDEHYIRSVKVSYTDTSGAAQTETRTYDSTKTAETAEFALVNAKPETIKVTAADYAYNSAEYAYTGFTAEVSSAYAEAADEALEGDVDATGFITAISGYGSVSSIKWTIVSNGTQKEFEAAEDELANITLDGGSANVYFMLRGLNDSAAQASVTVE